MKETKITYEGNKIRIDQKGLDLEYNGKKVGSRDVIDNYNKDQYKKIISDLEDQQIKFGKQRNDLLDEMAIIKKKFNPKEKKKIEEFVLMLNKAQAMGQYKQKVDELDNVVDALDAIGKQLGDLQSITIK